MPCALTSSDNSVRAVQKINFRIWRGIVQYLNAHNIRILYGFVQYLNAYKVVVVLTPGGCMDLTAVPGLFRTRSFKSKNNTR